MPNEMKGTKTNFDKSKNEKKIKVEVTTPIELEKHMFLEKSKP